jgi:glycosyltransferase involved in cell wall biosynthesis
VRILHLQGEYQPFGGAETYFRELCCIQRQMGHEIAVIYASEPPACQQFNSWEHFVGTSWGIRSGVKSIKPVLQLIDLISPDLIHMHVVHFTVSPIIIDAICRKWPVVYSVHDLLWLCLKNPAASELTNCARILPHGAPCNQRFGQGCLESGCLVPSHGLNVIRGIKNFLITALRLRTLKGARQFIVNSDYVKKILVDHSFPADRIHIIKPILFIPPKWKNYRNPQIQKKRADKLILYVGRLSKTKGIYDLIDAVSILNDPDWSLIIVGDGKDRPQLMSYVYAKGLSERIDFRGQLDRSDLADAFGAASILVMPSRCPETFGLVGIEALYFGLPVIACNVGAIGEWLIDGRSGFLFEPGKIVDLSTKIAALLSDKLLRDQMGEAAVLEGQRFMDSKLFLDQLHAVYDRAVREAS